MAMPPKDSISLSRKSMSKDNLAAMSDELLRSSMSRSRPNPASSTVDSSASLSRSRTSSKDVDKLADEMLQHSIATSRSRPPSYISRIDGTPSSRTPTLPSRAIPPSSGSVSRSKRPVSASSRPSHGSLKKQLQEEINHARAQVKHSNSNGLFKKMCSTDLLFLIDTTGSMASYIESVKNQVRGIVDEIEKTFFGESDVRIAIVGYKDHGDSPNVEFLDFTASLTDVHSFLSRLHADGGADLPEDVLGGVNQALNASWKQQTRCLIHIADAPAHGHTLHDLSEHDDYYYTPGSEPHGLVYEPLVKRLLQIHVNYAFLNVTPYTDRMILRFAEVYGRGNAKLLPSNQYFSQLEAVDAWSTPNFNSIASSKPQFEEHRLGTAFSELTHLVLKTVTSSLSRTVGRFTLSREKDNSTARHKSTGFMSAIREDSDSISEKSDIVLESGSPQWDDPAWFDETFDMEGFIPAGMHDASTLQSMMDSDDNIILSIAGVVVHARSRPFAKGAMRTASYAQTDASNNRFVIKSFIKENRGRPEVVEDMKVQALCKAFALEFNGLLKIDPPLDFVVTSCLSSKSKGTSTTSGDSRSLEPYIGGKYVKYNSNSGWINEDNSDEFNLMAQAFSHFTFERSWGHLLVNDLQGVNHLLTDPAIQTKSEDRFSLTDANLGSGGIKFFFVYHECNKYCQKLGLKSNRHMVKSGDYQFRETWPAMEPTTCCSNKFCRGIIRLSSSHESPKYPKFQWCDRCWPQLDVFTTRHMCEGPGENHDFEFSRFFYESQGEPVPKECEEHRLPDSASSGAAAVGGKMFSRRMSKKLSEASISGKMW